MINQPVSQSAQQQTASVDLDGARDSTSPPQLPAALQLHILSLLPPKEHALSSRLSPDAGQYFNGPASLSQPLPPHAVPWAMEVGQQHVRQLPFRHKLQLLSTAAASGSDVNRELALALLQPSVFPELLQRLVFYDGPDPGVAAAKAGHSQLLCWLLRHCPGLLCKDIVLRAASRYCDLDGLQTAWGLFQTSGFNSDGSSCPPVRQLEAVAESTTPDAVAKMEWVLGDNPHWTIAVAAARSGDVGRLLWLHSRGCPVGQFQVLESTLRHADLAVAQWLVDEAGCRLPTAGSSREWCALLASAVRLKDTLAKLRWLGERGAPPLRRAGGDFVAELACAAVAVGQVDVLQHLRALPGLTPQQDQLLLQKAFATARVVTSIPMLEYLRRAGTCGLPPGCW